MKKTYILAAIAAFSLIFTTQAFATEKSRTDLQTAIQDNKLREYNAEKTFDTLSHVSDSTFNKLSDGVDFFSICGEATTVNNNTVYYGPSIVLLANTFNGQTCDINAVGNTTEATADAPIYTNKAVKVQGMTCRNEADANANITFTLRTAAGATVPSVTCTIADGERDCVADIQTTTNIAAGATVAVAAASTSNVADNNGFVCNVAVTY
jgi:hypothetical protein